MQYETACNQIRDDITTLLLELRPPTSGAAYAAACATRNVAAALHHASGTPEDPRWDAALNSLRDFLEYFEAAPRLQHSPALLALHGFLQENAGLSVPRVLSALAS